MVKREAMDNLIRDALRQDVTAQEPPVSVRDDLLARAEANNAESEPVVGASIPPLANGLRDTRPALHDAVRLHHFDSELMDIFGAAQQRLIAVWILSGSSRY